MPEWIRVYSEFVFRWTHVVAGVLWIGHLYFFNFVNAQLVKTYDADSKKKVVPELMPRALYWFRWGAMYTWITGILLLAYVYYMSSGLVPAESTWTNGAASGLSMGLILLVFFIYDALWKMVKNETAGVAISFVLMSAVMYGLSTIFVGRALFIHLGALLGTIMFLNVWMRIWPSQKKIIAGIKGTGPAADAAVPALAGLRSKHNTYMSIPLLFLMVSNHYPAFYGNKYAWICAVSIVAAGWIVAKLLYGKSASPATTAIGDQK